MLSMILLILCVAIAVTFKLRLNVNRPPPGVKPLPSPTLVTHEYKTLHNIRCKRRFKAKKTLSKLHTGCVKLKFPQHFKEQLRTLLCERKQRSLEHCQSELEQRSLEHCQSEFKQRYLDHCQSELKQRSLEHCQSEHKQGSLEHCQSEHKKRYLEHCQSELVNEVMAHGKINECISQSIITEETVQSIEKKKTSQSMVSEDHLSLKHCRSEIGHKDSQRNICKVISQSIVSKESVHSIVKTVGTEENQMPLRQFQSELVIENVSQERIVLSQSIVIEEMIQSIVNEEIALLMKNESFSNQGTNREAQSFVNGDRAQTTVHQETTQSIVNQEKCQTTVHQETTQSIVNQEKCQTTVHQETTQSIVNQEKCQTTVYQETNQTVVNQEKCQTTTKSIVNQVESLHQFLSIPGGLVEEGGDAQLLQNIRTSLEKPLEKLIIHESYIGHNSSEDSVRNLKRNRTHGSLAAETPSLVELLERSSEQDKKAEMLTPQGSSESLFMSVLGSVGSSSGSEKSLEEASNSPEESNKVLETLFTTCRASQTSISPFEVEDARNSDHPVESGDHTVCRSRSVVVFDSQYEFSPSYVSIGFSAGDISFIPELKTWNLLASGF